MKKLEQRIIKEGNVLPGNILKVDKFLNQRIDPLLMIDIAKEFGKYFDMNEITLFLTIESSGIAIASICGSHFKKDVVFAKKNQKMNNDNFYKTKVFSYTHQEKFMLSIPKYLISPLDKIFIIDDFLANGEAINGLCRIISQAGATLIGVGCVVEKGFQIGGKKIREKGIKIKSLAIIDEMSNDKITFRKA